MEEVSDCNVDRRLVVAGGLATAVWAQSPRAALAASEAGHDAHSDWSWLVGNWEVEHRRLRHRLAQDTQWDSFRGKSVVWLTMGGLGTIDDNILDLSAGEYRATGIRALDPASARWLIWWLDGRSPTRIDPPVFGRFEGDGGIFTGENVFDGKPILVRFRWHDIFSSRPNWDQAFSPDGGRSWEINWANAFATAQFYDVLL